MFIYTRRKIGNATAAAEPDEDEDREDGGSDTCEGRGSHGSGEDCSVGWLPQLRPLGVYYVERERGGQ